jgi:hypothetical protein
MFLEEPSPEMFSQKIGKLNNLKVFGSKYTKVSKQDNQNQYNISYNMYVQSRLTL